MEATEEAISNALVAAETMVGRDGNRSEAEGGTEPIANQLPEGIFSSWMLRRVVLSHPVEPSRRMK